MILAPFSKTKKRRGKRKMIFNLVWEISGWE
jgi:hypothetical protein